VARPALPFTVATQIPITFQMYYINKTLNANFFGQSFTYSPHLCRAQSDSSRALTSGMLRRDGVNRNLVMGGLWKEALSSRLSCQSSSCFSRLSCNKRVKFAKPSYFENPILLFTYLPHNLTTSKLLGSNLGEGGAVRYNAGAAVCM